MVKPHEICYCAALVIVIGTALCADSLAELAHGFRILFVCMGAAAAAAELGKRMEARNDKKSRLQR